MHKSAGQNGTELNRVLEVILEEHITGGTEGPSERLYQNLSLIGTANDRLPYIPDDEIESIDNKLSSPDVENMAQGLKKALFYHESWLVGAFSEIFSNLVKQYSDEKALIGNVSKAIFELIGRHGKQELTISNIPHYKKQIKNELELLQSELFYIRTLKPSVLFLPGDGKLDARANRVDDPRAVYAAGLGIPVVYLDATAFDLGFSSEQDYNKQKETIWTNLIDKSLPSTKRGLLIVSKGHLNGRCMPDWMYTMAKTEGDNELLQEDKTDSAALGYHGQLKNHLNQKNIGAIIRGRITQR